MACCTLICHPNVHTGPGAEIAGQLSGAKGDGIVSAERMCRGIIMGRHQEILRGSRQIEFQIVNGSRQTFLFEQDAERFRMREVSAPTGAPNIVYISPSVMVSLVTDWGPCWTEAEFSGLVKVSASGWAPYLIMQQMFG